MMTFKMIGSLILATLPIFIMIGINIYLTVKDWEERTKEIGKWTKIEEDK